jgi:hypothetical protein
VTQGLSHGLGALNEKEARLLSARFFGKLRHGANAR